MLLLLLLLLLLLEDSSCPMSWAVTVATRAAADPLRAMTPRFTIRGRRPKPLTGRATVAFPAPAVLLTLRRGLTVVNPDAAEDHDDEDDEDDDEEEEEEDDDDDDE